MIGVIHLANEQRRQQREDVGLQKRNQDFEEVNRYRHKEGGRTIDAEGDGQANQREENDVPGQKVGEETNRQCHALDDHADHLDRDEHDEHGPRHAGRHEGMKETANSVLVDRTKDHEQKGDAGQAHGNVDVAGCRRKQRNQAHDVQRQDKEEEGTEERRHLHDVVLVMAKTGIHDLVADKDDKQFEEVGDARRRMVALPFSDHAGD